MMMVMVMMMSSRWIVVMILIGQVASREKEIDALKKQLTEASKGWRETSAALHESTSRMSLEPCLFACTRTL